MLVEKTMKRLFSAGCLVLFAVVLIAASLWAKRALSIDSCLDRGGRWSDEAAACERG
jgi:hypothetical protein